MISQSILVCDDHPIFRSGVVHCLQETAEFDVVAEASDVQSAIAKLQLYEPDVLVTDLSMPGRSGFDLLSWVREHMPEVRVIIISMHTELALAQKARSLGAIGFLAKEDAEVELVHALGSTAGEFYTSESIGKNTEHRIDVSHEVAPFVAALSKISPAEMKVLVLLTKSMTNKTIADELNISPRTVESHRFRLAEKLDAKGPNKLLELAIRYGDAIRSKA